MRLRLGFAVAAHLKAEVLLIDEVLAVGDAEFQKKCLKAMDTLRSGGRTVLFVSHNLGAVENLCSRVIWIDNGQIRQDGRARDIIKSYMASFVELQKKGYDLSDIKSRGGSGEIRYTGIEFLDADGHPKELLRSGDRVVAKFHYHASEPVEKPHFSIAVFTDTGMLVTSTGTWSHGVQIPLLPPGDGHVELEIDFLNLMPGRYYISLKLGTLSKMYDSLEHCTVLDIETSDYFGSGKGIEGRLGIIFLPCRWKIDGA
jgi:lipopolysaccharide transport system ATP-binding protein